MAIGRKVYAEGMSAYFWYFLAAVSLATSPHPRAAVVTQVCQGAHNCDVPYQQLPWAPWNLCRPIWAFTI